MELEFKVDTKERKQYFTAESFAHPAKMSLPLQLWLIEKYTKPSDVILDPMAGIGTILVGATLGRNIICVELEGKFCKMMWANRDKIMQRGPQMGYEMGRVDIIQGDARNLEGLVDKIITSPPFGEAMSGGGIARYGHFTDPELAQRAYSAENMNIKKQIKRVEEGRAKMKRPDVFTSEGNKAAKGFFEGNYSRDPQNIGNLPYGQIDKIVTSPPYAENPGTPSLGSVNKDDWGNEGKDIVARRGLERGYSRDTNGQLGNLPYGNIDAVITSPPYEGSLEASSRYTKGGIPERDKKLGQTGTYAELDESISRIRQHPRTDTSGGGDYGKSLAHPYSGSHDNIGNLKSQSYLEAMLQVYQQCHKVLRLGGLLILVTKNFIRNKAVIRLDLDTIKLCEQAGFKLTEQHKRKLPSQSFWRIIYYQKHPEVEKIEYEDILVFAKRG